MAKYRLQVRYDPTRYTCIIWPDLAKLCRVYRRRDAATYALRRAVYEAMSSDGLLDRPEAHRAMAWATAVEKGTLPVGTIRINVFGSFEFRLDRDE